MAFMRLPRLRRLFLPSRLYLRLRSSSLSHCLALIVLVFHPGLRDETRVNWAQELNNVLTCQEDIGGRKKVDKRREHEIDVYIRRQLPFYCYQTTVWAGPDYGRILESELLKLRDAWEKYQHRVYHITVEEGLEYLSR